MNKIIQTILAGSVMGGMMFLLLIGGAKVTKWVQRSTPDPISVTLNTSAYSLCRTATAIEYAKVDTEVMLEVGGTAFWLEDRALEMVKETCAKSGLGELKTRRRGEWPSPPAPRPAPAGPVAVLPSGP